VFCSSLEWISRKYDDIISIVGQQSAQCRTIMPVPPWSLPLPSINNMPNILIFWFAIAE
jgi:hypothetical protein